MWKQDILRQLKLWKGELRWRLAVNVKQYNLGRGDKKKKTTQFQRAKIIEVVTKQGEENVCLDMCVHMPACR